MTYFGRVENGAVLLDQDVKLPEGVKVRVEIVPASQEADEEGPTLYERLKPIIGIAKGLPPDLAQNHDHYLHGLPKK